MSPPLGSVEEAVQVAALPGVHGGSFCHRTTNDVDGATSSVASVINPI
jgi:hypothetical protein